MVTESPLLDGLMNDIPYLSGGLLICPGGFKGTKQWHRCAFVLVDGQWCFRSELVVSDSVIWGKKQLLTETVLDVQPGCDVAIARCRCKGGLHRLTALVHMEWITVTEPSLTVGKIEQRTGRVSGLDLAEDKMRIGR
jgi:hypothetical protein